MHFSFNIAKNPTVSSLNKFSKNIDKTWPGTKEHCTVIKQIRVKGITLKKYVRTTKSKKLLLYIDTQGSDLNVLKGLQQKIKIVEKGVMEAAVDKKDSLYQSNHTINDAKHFLEKITLRLQK